MPQSVLPDSAAVRRALEAAYADPALAPREPEPGVWDALAEWWRGVLRWLAELLGRVEVVEQGAPVVFWLVVGWAGLTLVAIVAHLVWTAVQATRGRERKGRKRGGRKREEEAAPVLPRTAEGWEEAARRAAAEGRRREAAAALYQAAVLRLDERGAVRYDPSKTPGDYRREARRDARAGPAFGAFLRLFEPVAFGGRALDAAGWERLRASAAEVGVRGAA